MHAANGLKEEEWDKMWAAAVFVLALMIVFIVTMLGYREPWGRAYGEDSSVFLPGGDNEPKLGLKGTACFEKSDVNTKLGTGLGRNMYTYNFR